MKVNPVGKEISEVERAYTAGFLDADGCIMATIEKHLEKRFKFRIRIIVKITQKDTVVLRWFFSRYQIGCLKKNRTTNDWIIRDQKEIKRFLQILEPFLKTKRKQAEKALTILNSDIFEFKDLIKLARLADSLAKLNVRSKNRRKNFVSMIQDISSPND